MTDQTVADLIRALRVSGRAWALCGHHYVTANKTDLIDELKGMSPNRRVRFTIRNSEGHRGSYPARIVRIDYIHEGV